MLARSARVWCFAAGLIGLLPAPLSAAEIVFTEVRYQDPGYDVSFDVVLEAGVDNVRRLLTDYANLADLSPTIVHSEILGPVQDGRARVRVVLRSCLWLVFCTRLNKVTDSSVSGAGDVIHVTVPALSDFREAREQLSINASATEAGRTRVSYRAYLVPKSRVPPVVGPWLIQRQIIKELTITAQQVESLAQTR